MTPADRELERLRDAAREANARARLHPLDPDLADRARAAKGELERALRASLSSAPRVRRGHG